MIAPATIIPPTANANANYNHNPNPNCNFTSCHAPNPILKI